MISLGMIIKKYTTRYSPYILNLPQSCNMHDCSNPVLPMVSRDKLIKRVGNWLQLVKPSKKSMWITSVLWLFLVQPLCASNSQSSTDNAPLSYSVQISSSGGNQTQINIHPSDTLLDLHGKVRKALEVPYNYGVKILSGDKVIVGEYINQENRGLSECGIGPGCELGYVVEKLCLFRPLNVVEIVRGSEYEVTVAEDMPNWQFTKLIIHAENAIRNKLNGNYIIKLAYMDNYMTQGEQGVKAGNYRIVIQSQTAEPIEPGKPFKLPQDMLNRSAAYEPILDSRWLDQVLPYQMHRMLTQDLLSNADIVVRVFYRMDKEGEWQDLCALSLSDGRNLSNVEFKYELISNNIPESIIQYNVYSIPICLNGNLVDQLIRPEVLRSAFDENNYKNIIMCNELAIFRSLLQAVVEYNDPDQPLHIINLDPEESRNLETIIRQKILDGGVKNSDFAGLNEMLIKAGLDIIDIDGTELSPGYTEDSIERSYQISRPATPKDTKRLSVGHQQNDLYLEYGRVPNEGIIQYLVLVYSVGDKHLMIHHAPQDNKCLVTIRNGVFGVSY